MRMFLMKGIQYLTDEQGQRNAVVIDLKRYKDLWEDFQDALTAKIREKEPKISLEEVERQLRTQGKLID